MRHIFPLKQNIGVVQNNLDILVIRQTRQVKSIFSSLGNRPYGTSHDSPIKVLIMNEHCVTSPVNFRGHGFLY
ncbi:hypothetical protein VIBNISFn118_730005 [Vibrio nigripulchritudo SFn118]|nr:hypothetical protein VIBNISFn118_730005 [Vibrio nigripulchritudo SFn118]